MKKVLVRWLDAGMETCHLSLEEAKNVTPMPRENVGFLLDQTEEKLVLSFGFIQDNQHHGQTLWDATLVIPSGFILEVIELTQPLQ